MSIKKVATYILAIVFLIIPLAGLHAEESIKPSAPEITEFKDVFPSHDSYVAVAYLHQDGTIKGYADGTFGPDKSINRAETLKIILKGSKINPTINVKAGIFPDVKSADWFASYVAKAKDLKIVKGDEKTGNFVPTRQVNKAEFLKMLLIANKIDVKSAQITKKTPTDIPSDAWFAPYMKYAYERGIISANSRGLLEPQKFLTRSEVSNMMYSLILIKNSANTKFLLQRAQAELAQIEIYIAASKFQKAKDTSEMAVSLTQQAYKNMPKDKIVLSAAKIAKSYDWLVDALIYGINKDFKKATEYANKSIDKATEAWEVSNAVQPIARYIKDRARDVLKQVGGVENK